MHAENWTQAPNCWDMSSALKNIFSIIYQEKNIHHKSNK